MDERDNFDKRCSHNGHGRAYLRLTFLRLIFAFFWSRCAGKPRPKNFYKDRSSCSKSLGVLSGMAITSTAPAKRPRILSAI